MFAVESEVVGYQQYALDTENPDDYVHNIGVQFQNVTADSYTITDTFFGVTIADGDQFFVFDPTYYGYTLYTYTEIATDVYGFGVLYADGSSDDPITSLTVNKGDNILYMPADASVKPSVAGKIASSGEQTLTFKVEGEDYIFPITNPFPQETKLSDLTCLVDGDQLFVWDSLYYGYTLYTYTEISLGVYGFGVLYADGTSGEPITDQDFVVFGVGQGGMYMPAESRTWTVTLNY